MADAATIRRWPDMTPEERRQFLAPNPNICLWGDVPEEAKKQAEDEWRAALQNVTTGKGKDNG